MIIARAVVAYLADVGPAFAGEVRGVDHVHAVRIAAHQAGQHRSGDRLEVEFGGGTLDLDRDRREIVVRELADEAAELFGEAHIGRSAEHTSELQSLMRISYAVFCLKKKNKISSL